MSGPYLTQVELQNAPTGINWSSIPQKGATVQQQAAEMFNLVLRATAWVDGWCGQKLQATADLDTVPIPGRRAVTRRDGALYMSVRYSPLISIQSVKYAIDAATWSTISGNPLVLDRSSFLLVPGVQALNVPTTFDPTTGYLQVSYTDGYPNALLTQAQAINDTTVTVDDATGILPGSILTIYDTETTQEQVQVALSYTAGVGVQVLPLTAGLANAHSKGARISGLPVAVREATLLACLHYVRTRGRDTVSISPAGGVRASRNVGSSDELDEAQALLVPFMRVV